MGTACYNWLLYATYYFETMITFFCVWVGGCAQNGRLKVILLGVMHSHMTWIKEYDWLKVSNVA